MFAVSGDHARGLGAYSNWGAETYLTTYGSQHGTGDYYGINNISVVSGIAGANGNCMQFRLNPNDGTGKKVGACPFPNVSGTAGTSAAASAMLYGRYEARFMATSTSGWKTAWLWWPKTWKWTAEIDGPEGGLNGTIGAFNHWPNNTSQQDAFSTSARFTTWHTWATEWSPSSVKFILDGTTIGTSTRVPTEQLFFQLQTENNLGSTQPTSTAYVWVDYVALYSWAG
jgi:hypothetical protein